MERFEKPWQAMPSRMISLALKHAEQNSDFDHQLAFLLLDIGVETALKTYLINKKQDVEKIGFRDLLNRTDEELSKDKSNFPLDEIDYFHKIRNKLYHQGDGIKATDEDLRKYIELAKKLLKSLLDVDIIEPTLDVTYSLLDIQKNLTSIQSASSIIVEHLYPQIAPRKIEGQLRFIRTETGPDDIDYPPSVRAEFVQQRIDSFNKITGWTFSEDDFEFVEYIIDNPEQFNVWLAFQEINNDEWQKDWYKHQTAVDFIEKSSYSWSKFNEIQIKEIYESTHKQALTICGWVKDHIPNIEPKGPGWKGFTI